MIKFKFNQIVSFSLNYCRSTSKIPRGLKPNQVQDNEYHADADCHQQQDVKNRVFIELQGLKRGRPALRVAILLVSAEKAI
jgi:hypothetical protein